MKFLLVIAFFFLGCAESNTQRQPAYEAPEISYDCHIVPDITDDLNKPNVLIVGDSISLLYTQGVRDSQPNFDVYHNPCNAQSSVYTLKHIDQFLSPFQSYDAIIFNNGIWDANLPVPDWQYESNLRQIAIKIKAKTNRPFFVSSTAGNPARFEKLRAIAQKVMTEQNIPIIDLHKYVKDNNIQPGHDTVHFEQPESAIIGQFIGSHL